MQINHNALPCCDARICGHAFKAADEDSCYAVFSLDSCACGVTIEEGSATPWLRLTPAVQLPPCARDGFVRFQFEHADPSLVELTADTVDGELTLRRDLPDLSPAAIEPILQAALTWIDTQAYPAVSGYIRTCCQP